MVSFSQSTLPNGLTVIVHESHRVPLVAVNVWYHVGSRHEAPGQTGLAHLFEHLMFEGAEHQPRGYFEPLQRAGGAVNGSTSPDRTNYWETVPTSALRLALWMEADRMGWMAPALTEARFNTQRGVVINERRESYENRPYGRAAFALLRALFPEGHPYRWPTIGSVADLERATLDDARAFLARYYQPGNASLVVAGDVRAEDVVPVIEELFGPILGSDPPAPMRVAAPAAQASRTVVEDRDQIPRRYLGWPCRPMLGSFFQVAATAAPGTSLATLESAIGEEIARLATEGPDDAEMARGRAQAEAAFVYRVQSLGGFGGIADQLNAYYYHRKTPDWFDADLRRYTDATREGIRRGAARWLDPARAAALSVVPSGQRDLALPDSVLADDDL